MDLRNFEGIFNEKFEILRTELTNKLINFRKEIRYGIYGVITMNITIISFMFLAYFDMSLQMKDNVFQVEYVGQENAIAYQERIKQVLDSQENIDNSKRDEERQAMFAFFEKINKDNLRIMLETLKVARPNIALQQDVKKIKAEVNLLKSQIQKIKEQLDTTKQKKQ